MYHIAGTLSYVLSITPNETKFKIQNGDTTLPVFSFCYCYLRIKLNIKGRSSGEALEPSVCHLSAAVIPSSSGVGKGRLIVRQCDL